MFVIIMVVLACACVFVIIMGGVVGCVDVCDHHGCVVLMFVTIMVVLVCACVFVIIMVVLVCACVCDHIGCVGACVYLDGLCVVEVGAQVHQQPGHPGGHVVGAGQDAGAQAQDARVAAHQICPGTERRGVHNQRELDLSS